jgi:hypothetical protein
MHDALRDRAREHRFDGSSCQEQRVCEAEWQARCHEKRREEYQVNACHVHYSLLAQIGHQTCGCERRQRQCLGQLTEESLDLILIVDHSAGS